MAKNKNATETTSEPQVGNGQNDIIDAAPVVTPKKKKPRKVIKWRMDVYAKDDAERKNVLRSITLSSKDDCKAVKALLIATAVFTDENAFFVVKLINAPAETV